MKAEPARLRPPLTTMLPSDPMADRARCRSTYSVPSPGAVGRATERAVHEVEVRD